ncbi:MAG: transporter [Bacteroidota bacterium]
MKKTLLLAFGLAITSTTIAQNITDGLRYGNDFTTGTARFNAMSGAFGALGGDMSAIAINPAGSAVFLQNGATFTAAVKGVDSDALYFGNNTQSSENDLNISQAGGVFIFENGQENSNWQKFSLAVNYNQTNSHDNDLFISGLGNTSIASFFTEQAQGISLEVLQLQNGENISDVYSFLGETQGTGAQNAFLGFQGFIFDPVSEDPGNTQYVSNVGAGRFNQNYIHLSQGQNGKYTFNLGAQYSDNLFFGININSHIIDYEESTLLIESNSNQGSSVDRIQFENNLSVVGAGFSAQLGTIVKLNNVRLGFTYDTPTWFVISEETTQYLETRRTVDNQSITEIVNPRIINVFADYNLRTPGQYTGSAAYIFGKDGLLSFDYSYKDFSNIEFSPSSDPSFAIQNQIISNTLKGVSSFKIGGEYRIHELSIRGGLSYEDSPYQDDTILGDRQGFSLGLGYNLGNYTFDLAYSRAEQSRNQQLYTVGLTDTAAIDAVYNNFLFTLGLNL